MIELGAFVLTVVFVAFVLLLTGIGMVIGMVMWWVRTVAGRKRAKHARKKVQSSMSHFDEVAR